MDKILTSIDPPAFLKLIAHDVRWHLLEILAASDRRVQELVAHLNHPQNLVSYHLSKLRRMGLVRERRSSHDARDVYYSLDLERLQMLFGAAGQALHPALTFPTPQTRDDRSNRKDRQPVRVLFLCTHNSARSQMAEGILRSHGRGLVEAFSAGSEPGEVHPFAVRAMQAMNIDITDHRTRHMDEFVGQSFDYIITVCDRVREVCPMFPNDPQRTHWSLADPAAVEGTEATRHEAFMTTAQYLRTRINFLLVSIR